MAAATYTNAWTFFTVVCAIISTALACPPRCKCTGSKVVCKMSKLQAFPAGIPDSVTSIVIESTSPTDKNNFGQLVRGNFSKFLQIEELVFIRCGITGMASDAFMDLKKLKSLTLKHNELRALYPNTFGSAQAQTLRTLNLSSNALTQLYDFTFRGLKLDLLDLADNDISSVGEQTFFESSVKILNLGFNKVGSLTPATLKPLAGSLTKLYLQRNGIKSLDTNLLSSFTKLTDLDLEYNMIRELPAAILEPLVKLTRLNLKGNALVGLKEDFLAVLNRLQAISIDGNPLHCNCEVKWMKTFAHPNQTCQKPEKCFQSVRCATPKDILLKNFPDEDLKCASVEIFATRVKRSTATCQARGDPAPNVWWKSPSGVPISATNVYGVTETNSTITLTLYSEIGSYQCFAGNVRGNASAVVKDVGTCQSRNVCYGPGDIAGAVLGTLGICVLIVFLLYVFRHKLFDRKPARKKQAPRFKNNVYRDITMAKSAENERL